MKPWDERVYETIALKRSAFFRPTAVILSKLGISPDALSYLGLAISVVFIYAVGKNLAIAFWLLIAMLVCDQLDGAVARYRKTDGDRGKYVDVTVDSTTFAFVIIGLAHAGFVGAATAGTYIYFATAQRVLSAIEKNRSRPHSVWLFYAGAGPLPSTFIYATYFLFGIAYVTGHDYLQVTSLIFACLLGLKAAFDFAKIRYKS